MMEDIHDSQEPHRPPLTAEPVESTDSDVSSATLKSMSEDSFGTSVHGKKLDTDEPEVDSSVGEESFGRIVGQFEGSVVSPALLNKDSRDSDDGDAAERLKTEHRVEMMCDLNKDEDDMVGSGEIVEKEDQDQDEEETKNTSYKEKTKDQYSNGHAARTKTLTDNCANVVKHGLDQPSTADISTRNDNNAITITPTTELAQLKLQPEDIGSNIGDETHQRLAHENRRRPVDTFRTPAPQRPAYSRAHTSRTSVRSNSSPTPAGRSPQPKKPERPSPPPHYPPSERKTSTNEKLNGHLRTPLNGTSPKKQKDSQSPPLQSHEQDRGNNLTQTDVLNLLHSRDVAISRLQGTVTSLNARLLKLESHKRQSIPNFSSSSTYSVSDKLNGTEGRFTAGTTTTVEDRRAENKLKQKEVNTVTRTGNKDEDDYGEEGDVHGVTMWSVYVGLIFAAATLGGVLGAAMERGEVGDIFAEWMWKQGRGG